MVIDIKTNSTDPVKNGQTAGAISAANAADNHKLDSNLYKKIAQELIKESESGQQASNGKKEEAQAYILAAKAMEKMADAVRQKAALLSQNKVEKEEALKAAREAVEKHGLVLEFPLPKDASPELLEKIADSLEQKAKENRIKADELLKDAETLQRHSDNLKKQADMIHKKEMNFSEMDLKSGAAHNEGLNMIFKKLGINKVDAEYKQQLEYAENKASDQSRLGY